ncbi:MAG TPA: DUF4184 family protein [Candidatus Angelobacter sp.]|nr:DUF4184 family protein [Candidatus Angelobacter sp.]
MPFPLAHPAAILPFRRWSGRWLDFSALVIGAVTPDLSYCFLTDAGRYGVGGFAHSLGGCLGFSLPVGWMLTLLFYSVGGPLVERLPAPHREVLVPRCRQFPRSWHTIPLSVLIGAITHVFWDAFTHETGWFVERSDLLQQILFTVNNRPFRVYWLLWHLSTWTGIGLVSWFYARAVKRRTGSGRLFLVGETGLYFKWFGVLLLPTLVVLPFTLHSLGTESWTSPAFGRALRAALAMYVIVLIAVLACAGAWLKVREREGG